MWVILKIKTLLVRNKKYLHQCRPSYTGIRTVARPDTSPMDTSSKIHPRQIVARCTLTRKTVARPDSNPTGQ